MSLAMDVERLSVPELMEVIQRVGLRLLTTAEMAGPLWITDEANRPRGYLSAVPADYEPPSDEELAELRRRVDNPDAKFLTVDEFFAALDDEPSVAPAP